MSNKEERILKAVEGLQQTDSVKNMVSNLDEFFDHMVGSEGFGSFKPAYRKELTSTYRNLRNFLAQLPDP